MVFLIGDNGVLFLMLTELDVADMRGGRTKFVDKQTMKKSFSSVVISVHKNQSEIESMIRAAG